MANMQLLNIIQKSVKQWNQFRKAQPHSMATDLSKADLGEADLTDADLTEAFLWRTFLMRANLTRADLTDADLTDADLTEANLTDANLTGADLTGADLTRANLTRANLENANLTGVTGLAGAQLESVLEQDLTVVPHEESPETIESENARETPGDGIVRTAAGGNTRITQGKGKRVAVGTAFDALDAEIVFAETSEPTLSPYQTLLITTPLAAPGFENPTLAAFAINLSSKQNELSANWRIRVVKNSPGWGISPIGTADEFIDHICGDEPVLANAIKEAIANETAAGYFGSLRELSLKVLDGVGADKIGAVVQVGEQVASIGFVQIGGSIVCLAVFTGAGKGIHTALSTEIPRIARKLVDHVFADYKSEPLDFHRPASPDGEPEYPDHLIRTEADSDDEPN